MKYWSYTKKTKKELLHVVEKEWFNLKEWKSPNSSRVGKGVVRGGAKSLPQNRISGALLPRTYEGRF